MTSPAPAWTLADVIDFEHQLAETSGGDEDRLLYESEIGPRLGAATPDDRRAVFRAWLAARLARGGRSIGASYEAGRRALQSVALVAGFVLGAALAGALLAHGSGEPVNALLFFFWTVAVQGAVLVLALAGWLLRRLGVQWAPLKGLVELLLSGASTLVRRLPGERRERLRSTLATLKRRHDVHGSLLAWPAAIVTQWFGVAFNLGLLFAMLFVHLPFAELRFGWQSTYPVSPAQVHRAVQAVATPWRWLAPGLQPTPAEIEATRYARGQNAQSLPSDAARAWWPFLVLSIACYGLLLRALLLASASAMLQRRLARLAFDHPDANALWRRLRGPLVTARGGEAAIDERSMGGEPATHHTPGGSCVVIVSEEVAMPEPELRSRVRERLGCAAQQLMRASIDDRHAAAALRAGLDAAGAAAIVIVVPASRDPIVAVALFLREVTGAAPAGIEVIVLLVAAGAVDDDRFAVWQRFKSIQRLSLSIER